MIGEFAALATAVLWSFSSIFFTIGGRYDTLAQLHSVESG